MISAFSCARQHKLHLAFSVVFTLLMMSLLLQKHEVTLLDRATRVTGTDDWGVQPPCTTLSGLHVLVGNDYSWLSENEVLSLRGTLLPKVQYMPDGQIITVQPRSYQPGTIYSYNQATLLTKTFPLLTTCFQQSQGAASSFCVSANGQTAGWEGMSGSAYYTLNLHNPELRKWASEGEVYCSADSRNLFSVKCIETSPTCDILKHGLDEITPDRAFHTAVSVDDSFIKVFTPSDDLITTSWNGSPLPVSQVEFCKTTLTGADSSTTKYKTSLPFQATIQEVAISPKTNKVAWILTGQYKSSLTILTHYLFPALVQKMQCTSGIWVSNLDGSAMHEIGTIPIPLNRSSAQSLFLLHWLPEEKKLSFIYNNSLYTIPAN